MAILSKESLFEKVEKAIEQNNCKILSKSETTQQPVRMEISDGKEVHILRVYIWNLSHGGGVQRPDNEYRIQVKVDRFEEESNSKTLILGYWDEGGVFAGFDISKHIGKPGWSASMQIKKEYLEDANKNQVAAYSKENGEIAIAFTPSFFITYVNDLYDLHLTGNLNKYFIGAEKGDEDIYEDESETETLPFRYSITSYGADYPVDMIVKRIKDGVIYIPPFQRNYIWSIKEASRFIESLILGLPVPGVFLSKQEDLGKMLIVDGQQRLFSLYTFYENNFKGKSFKLTGVLPELEGKTYSELSGTDKSRLDDSIIHATIIRQDEPDDNESSIYQIFERLNSSGRPLSSQEVRACVYYGSFNQYLTTIVLQKEWRALFGAMNERLKEQEMLLRFLALYFERNSYEKPLTSFLNKFMQQNRNFEKYRQEQFDDVIIPTISFLSQTLGRNAFRLTTVINVSVFDSIMIGLANRLQNGPITAINDFNTAYSELLADPVYSKDVKEGTSDKTVLERRIASSIEKFQSLQ